MMQREFNRHFNTATEVGITVGGAVAAFIVFWLVIGDAAKRHAICDFDCRWSAILQ